MNSANTANTEIGELVARIRAWQLAREAHRNASPNQGGTWHAVQYAAKEVTGSFLNSDDVLPAFTALADHVDSLQARNSEQAATLAWYADRKHYRQRFDPEIDDFTSDIDEDGGLRAHKQLTAGVDEGEA